MFEKVAISRPQGRGKGAMVNRVCFLPLKTQKALKNQVFITMKICEANQPHFFTIHSYLLLSKKSVHAELVKSEE